MTFSTTRGYFTDEKNPVHVTLACNHSKYHLLKHDWVSIVVPLVERIVTFLQRRPLPSPTHQQKGELVALIVILKSMWWTEKTGEICSAKPLLGITKSLLQNQTHTRTHTAVCVYSTSCILFMLCCSIICDCLQRSSSAVRQTSWNHV